MWRRLFWKEAGIEIRPDGTQVQKWQRRSLRTWLLYRLIGKDRVLANLDLCGQQLDATGPGRVILFGLRTDSDSKIRV